MYLLSSLFTTTASLVQENPLYNKDFLAKFEDPRDKKLLDQVVKEQKDNHDRSPRKIQLSKGEVTIVVN